MYSLTNIPLIAKNDIVCYKAVIEKDNFYYNDSGFPTHKPEGTYHNMEEHIIPKKIDPSVGLVYNISIGYTEAKKYFPAYLLAFGYKIFKCIIPKGTEYFKNRQCYKTKCITYIEEIIQVKTVTYNVCAQSDRMIKPQTFVLTLILEDRNYSDNELEEVFKYELIDNCKGIPKIINFKIQQ